MDFITIRKLKTQAAKIWDRLERNHDLVLTSHGRPVAVLVKTGEDDLERTLADLKAMRGLRAMENMRTGAKTKGLDALSLADINAEIKATRADRRKLDKQGRRH